jgi:hypothetical protein
MLTRSRQKLERSNRPLPEAVAAMRATVTRLTGVRLEAEHVANLDDGECRELIELTGKIGRDNDGQPAAMNRSRLSAKEARR